MTIRVLVTATGIALLLANPGWAQVIDDRSTTASTTSPLPRRLFRREASTPLSPGNQKIDNALFSGSENHRDNDTLTKDQIAGLKGTEGLGQGVRDDEGGWRYLVSGQESPARS